jgi:hypothetical protein
MKNQERMKANHGRIKSKAVATSMKFEVLRENVWAIQEKIQTRVCALISRIDACQARIDSHHEEIIAIMKTSLVNTEARMDSGQI